MLDSNCLQSCNRAKGHGIANLCPIWNKLKPKGLKYHNIHGIWALKPYYLGPWQGRMEEWHAVN